jgi:putative ubiquitin-RnfH superfamily antitoxin RatB of RatAB toxin-antitoxin module
VPDKISVEVVYATPDRQVLLPVEVAAASTVEDAIRISGIQKRFDEALDECEAGVWGRVVERTHILSDGDRVEIYRPLLRDPMDARRELARAQRLGSSS